MSMVPIALLLAAVLPPQGGPPPTPGGQRSQTNQSRPQNPDQGGLPPTISQMVEIAPSVTHHTINLHGAPLAYTATASQIPLRNENNDVECRMFYVAYTKDGADSHTRPVTFAFNGGPGSATIWLHMGALGPKKAPLNDDGTLPNPPYVPVDNQDTWLDFTDVVVIDAPGTGYSRIARPDLASKYFGLQPDVQAFTQFVRNWLTTHHRWSSPLFIAGESYGGIRGSSLSASLFRSGIAVNGFVSISGTSNFMTLDGMRGNDATYVSFLPSMAACAWYHHRLSARFKSVDQVVDECRQWIDQTYAAALQRGDSLTAAEKDKVAAKLAEFLGIGKGYVLGSNLRITERQFFRELLRDQRLTIGRYDGRLTGREELEVGERGSGDPSDDMTTAPFTSSLNAYLDEDLGVHTTLPYLNFGNVYPWTEVQGSYSETASELRNLLARNQHFRVLYCMGYYDLACPLNGTIFTVNHMGLDPQSRSHIAYAYYPAGHMMYIEKSSREKLHEDVKRFEAECLAGK